ncbi:MAG: 4-hydroxy-tetrahydrodipicolinate synthase [Acidobacteria bacterium]|nr:4-hydroxy-tetrahydrodipicolinate synthase [Acidobacteriota bacterium]MCA1609645.1 4-hydroxy-tetrahydrodipicolinate synthase [Acidobacteriota bacterium]
MKGPGKRVEWQGCGTALVTPFDERGRIDFGALGRLVEWQIAEGIDFLVPCGTTGEASTLSGDERKAVTAAVAAAANGRVPVIAGAGGNHTAKAVFWARDAEAAGADGILSVTPMYNKPTAEGLFRHYSAISDASRLPILVYNVPGRTGTDLDVETILRLAEVPNVVGLKEASPNFGKIARLLTLVPPDFAVFSGDDSTALALIALGGRGLISVASNEIPGEMRTLVARALEGDWTAARKLQARWLPLMEMNFWESSPGPAKCALSLMKKCGETLRLPLAPVRDETRRRIEAVVVGMKLSGKRGGAKR